MARSSLSRPVWLTHWLRGIRFYIGVAIVVLSLESWWWAATGYSGTSLFAIRLAEVYAWLSLSFLCTALLIGPVCAVFKRFPGRKLLFDARRLLGIGAAWFASLHITVVYDALFKFANPLHIPGDYQPAFLVGVIAWIILLAMAFTSFDKAFTRMGKWWFRLHRFVYAAISLTLLHAFMIGAQASRPAVLLLLGTVVAIGFGLQCLAIIRQGHPASNWQMVTVATMTAVFVIVFSYGYTQRDKYQVSSSKGSSYAAIR